MRYWWFQFLMHPFELLQSTLYIAVYPVVGAYLPSPKTLTREITSSQIRVSGKGRYTASPYLCRHNVSPLSLTLRTAYLLYTMSPGTSLSLPFKLIKYWLQCNSTVPLSMYLLQGTSSLFWEPLSQNPDSPLCLDQRLIIADNTPFHILGHAYGLSGLLLHTFSL